MGNKGVLNFKTKDGGYTLAELLIVVAIVGILVAISIPIFSAKLEKSREAVDIANLRAATSLAIEYAYHGLTEKNCSEYGLTNQWVTTNSPAHAWGVYDPKKGTFVPKYEDIDGVAYGKGTATDAGTVFKGYNSDVPYTSSVIEVSIFYNEKIEVGFKPARNVSGSKNNNGGGDKYTAMYYGHSDRNDCCVVLKLY